jgi:8-oxo-dGTP pyrophosphatase MutT (NUDIX family)
MNDWPKIKSRKRSRISPWVEIIEREVEFAQGSKSEIYHAIGQQDYIAIVAMTPEKKIPIVRQYRPAVETFTWELPAGMVDQGEDAAECCKRELLEETGFPARAVHALGNYSPCTARLSNRVHSFFVETGAQDAAKKTESAIELRLATPAELGALIRSGEFTLQLHIGALMLAGARGFLDLGAFKA